MAAGSAVLGLEYPALLKLLQITPSAKLNSQLLDTLPQVVQVWYEPDSPTQTPTISAAPQPILVLHGTTKLDVQAINWLLSDNADATGKAFGAGGRLLIRVHVSHLFDVDSRPFAPSLEALTGVAYPHVPGGAWESWVFVRPNLQAPVPQPPPRIRARASRK